MNGRDAVETGMAQLDHLPGEETIRRLSGIRNLPTLPTIVEKVRVAARDPSIGAQRVAAIIADDPAMAARVLKIANSSLYGGREPIGSLPLAMSRIGVSTACSLATSMAMFDSFGTTAEGGFDKRDFWRHSVMCGLAAVVLREKCQARIGRRYANDALHLAGLLHDIGKIVLAQHFGDHFLTALEKARSARRPLAEVEAEVMGVDHARIGTWIGLKWKIPDELLQAVRCHHNPADCPESMRPLVALIHAANYVCNFGKLGGAGDTAAPVLNVEVKTLLGLTDDDLPVLIGQVLAQAARSEVLVALG